MHMYRKAEGENYDVYHASQDCDREQESGLGLIFLQLAEIVCPKEHACRLYFRKFWALAREYGTSVSQRC